MNATLTKKFLRTFSIVLLPITSAYAIPITPSIPLLTQEAKSNAVQHALKQNKSHSKPTSRYQAKKLNTAWKQQIPIKQQPLIKPIINNPLAAQLAKAVKKSHGKLDAIWVIDDQGFSIAQSKILPRYWFGDLAIFKKSIHNQAGHWYIGRAHTLHGTSMRGITLSMPILNSQKQVIGVLAADEIVGGVLKK